MLAPLTAEQERISNEFMREWLEELRQHYSIAERFSHGYPVTVSDFPFVSTLEVGAGLGEHLHYETLSAEQLRNYTAIDLRANIVEALRAALPQIRVLQADCQEPMAIAAGSIDRILAIHVLEHLPNLPAAVEELHRVCVKPAGRLIVVIPCEGGFAYSLARKISAERFYKRRFGGSYKWLYSREHINLPHEVLTELERYFTVERRSYFPLPFLPATTMNLCIGLRLKPR
ncbi:MAG TPA: class I SAM-dependent methyltransferase [Candidatus Baltobacteraceae bacterium]